MWETIRNGLKKKKRANMKCSVFELEQPTRVLQNVAGINNKTFGDEPLKVMLYWGKILGRPQFWRPSMGFGLPLVSQGQEEEMFLSEGGRR